MIFGFLDIVTGLGMGLSIFGALVKVGTLQKSLFLIGALLMSIAPLVNRHRFFIALEIVVVLGTAVAFLPFSVFVKALFPLAAGALALIWLLKHNELESSHSKIGAFGILMLALGYAVSHAAIYLVGGFVLAIYAFQEAKSGYRLAYYWSALNGFFVITAGVGVWRLFN